MKPPTLGDMLSGSENFNYDKEECYTLRYDEESKNLAAGYSTGKIAIYNFEKKEKDQIIENLMLYLLFQLHV